MTEPTKTSSTTPIVTSRPSPHVRAPGERERTSEAVVAAVADATDRDPLSLPALYEVVDPDALDAIFADGGVTVSFSYADCEVVVDDDAVLVTRSA
jgi:hypothetical protein